MSVTDFVRVQTVGKLFVVFSLPFLFAVVVVVPECEKSSATTYFWYRQTLNITSSIDDTGGLNWKMTLSLLVAWILVCLAVIKGIQSSGKVRGVHCFTAGKEPANYTDCRSVEECTKPLNKDACSKIILTKITLKILSLTFMD